MATTSEATTIEAYKRPAHKNQYTDTAYIALHVTKYCNLQCSYCFEAAPSSASGVRDPARFMSLDVLRQTMTQAFQHSRRALLKVLFFGGEPLLIGADWIRDAARLVRSEAARWNKGVKLSMTTNGTLVDDDVSRMLVEEGIGVCVSIDGPPSLHNRSRGNGRGMMRGLAALRNAGARLNTICVLNPDNIAHVDEILAFFESEGITVGRLAPMHYAGSAIGPKRVEFADYDTPIQAVLKVLGYMLDHRGTGFVDHTLMRRIQQYVNHLRGAVRPPGSYDCFTRTCWAGQGYLAVDPTGARYPCSRAIEPHYHLGDVFEAPRPEQYRAPPLEALHARGLEYFDCDMCPAKPVCFAGCAVHNKTDDRNWILDCLLTKAIHRVLESRRMDVLHLAEVWRRKEGGRAGVQRVADDAVIEVLRAFSLNQVAPLWARAGLVVARKGATLYLVDTEAGTCGAVEDDTLAFLANLKGVEEQIGPAELDEFLL